MHKTLSNSRHHGADRQKRECRTGRRKHSGCLTWRQSGEQGWIRSHSHSMMRPVAKTGPSRHQGSEDEQDGERQLEAWTRWE